MKLWVRFRLDFHHGHIDVHLDTHHHGHHHHHHEVEPIIIEVRVSSETATGYSQKLAILDCGSTTSSACSTSASRVRPSDWSSRYE